MFLKRNSFNTLVKCVKTRKSRRYRSQFKPTHIQHTKATSSRHIRCPSQGQGAAVAGGPRGPYGETRVQGVLGLSASGHSVDCFNSHVFPKQEKRTQKRRFKSRLSSETRFTSGTRSRRLRDAFRLAALGVDRTFALVKGILPKVEKQRGNFRTSLSLRNSCC